MRRAGKIILGVMGFLSAMTFGNALGHQNSEAWPMLVVAIVFTVLSHTVDPRRVP